MADGNRSRLMTILAAYGSARGRRGVPIVVALSTTFACVSSRPSGVRETSDSRTERATGSALPTLRVSTVTILREDLTEANVETFAHFAALSSRHGCAVDKQADIVITVCTEGVIAVVLTRRLRTTDPTIRVAGSGEPPPAETLEVACVAPLNRERCAALFAAILRERAP